VEIIGECGGEWVLTRTDRAWLMVQEWQGEFAARVVIPQELAWRIFTKGIDRHGTQGRVAIYGNRDLGERVLQLAAIVG